MLQGVSDTAIGSSFLAEPSYKGASSTSLCQGGGKGGGLRAEFFRKEDKSCGHVAAAGRHQVLTFGTQLNAQSFSQVHVTALVSFLGLGVRPCPNPKNPLSFNCTLAKLIQRTTDCLPQSQFRPTV